MSLTHHFHCEICGREKQAGSWFMAEIKDGGLLVSAWREVRAFAEGVHHFCGEAHAQVFVARYLSSPESFSSRNRYSLNPEDKDLTAVQSHLVKKVMQQSDETTDEDEMIDLLAAAEAALKGRVTVDSLSVEHFDA